MALWLAARVLFFSLLFAVTILAQSDRVEQLHAEASTAEASGNLDTAVAKYREILKLDPELAPAYNNLGALYVKQGRFADAVDVLERGLKVDSRMSSARALLGVSLFQIGEYAKARPYLEAVLKTNPTDNNAELLLVNDLTKLGDFNAAAEHLQKLSQRQPRDEHIWYLLGRVYMQLGEQALAKMNDIDPNSVWAHQISAELMESMKNYNGAIVEYKKAIEVAPQQPGLHFKLGDLYWSLQQWDNATEQFLAEQKVDPRNCLIEYKLGDILVNQGVEMESALKHVDKALAACPNLTEAKADRGRALIKLHREQEAIPDLLAAEKANPAEASTHFLLAQAYRATGRPEKARTEMKTFSELEQKSRNAQAERASEVIQTGQSAH